VAWEDRTPAQKAEARKAERQYRKTDDDAKYVVTTGQGSRVIVTGRNSARAVAGKDGTYKKK
jgi:hypothetical protein